MLAPCYSFLDSEQEIVTGGGPEEFGGELDVTGTLFATLLSDDTEENRTSICSEIMSSNSDTESDDMLDYLSKTEEKGFRTEKETDKQITMAESCANNSVRKRKPLMCSTNVSKKYPRVELKRIETVKPESEPKTDKCMSRNAIIARENRERKKQYIKQLESNLEEIKVENYDLKARLDAKTKHCEFLQKEAQYLRNVLANQSCIAALLQNIHATQGVTFTSSLTANVNSENRNLQKKALDENDNYENTSKGIYVRAAGSHRKVKSNQGEAKVDDINSPLTPCPSPDGVNSAGGVCLHVSDNKVSLELCAQCSENASNVWKSGDHTYFKS